MKVSHSFHIEGKCPTMSGHIDSYHCTLTTDRLILVEDIRPKLERTLAEPIYQEDLAKKISEIFGCSVKLVGAHPGGFTTEVEVS